MIDSFTKKRIRVVDDGGDEPYIIVRVDQLDAVEGILDRAGCHYDVDDEEVSVNGHPFVTIVSLRPNADVAAMQNMLDDEAAPQDYTPEEITEWPSRMRSTPSQSTPGTIWTTCSISGRISTRSGTTSSSRLTMGSH